jgi:hypothetical protein
MNIFISWSGDLSKQIGEVFKEWMPTVIQTIRPYYTPSDIEKGSKWESEISRKLVECSVGVILVTKENLNSQWIMFEAGALSCKLDKSRVCPILIGIENTDLTGPLATFQTTNFNSEDIKKLMYSINKLSENKLDDRVFENVFNKFWPDLEKKVSEIVTNYNAGNKSKTTTQQIRSDRDLLEEILELLRIDHIKKESLIRDKGIRRYEDLPYVNKQKLKDIVLDYLVVKGIKIKDYETIDKDEMCEYLDKMPRVRELVHRPEILRRFLDDFINLLH